MVTLLVTPATVSDRPPVRLLLAHGAGAPMDSPFMAQAAEALGRHGIEVVRFEFPYMAARRTGGSRRPPPKADALCDAYRDAVAALPRDGRALFIGGKSLGGRVASLLADELLRARRVRGLVCLGYPFHPANDPTALRTAHLAGLLCPTLIVQGERDPFGARSEIDAAQRDWTLSAAIRLAWIDDGDHDLGPRGASGFTRKGNLAAAATAVADFVHAHR
jgi:hypothetical protein